MPPDAVPRSVAHLPQRKIWQRYAFAFNPVNLSLFSLAYLVAYLCAIATFAMVTYPIAAAPTKEVRRILILNEVNSTYPGISLINEGIQTALNDSPYHLDFYSEYMDTSLFPDPALQQEFRDSYIRKYQNRKLDVIITVGPSPLKFIQEVHQRSFPGVPIVFCLPILLVPGAPALDSDFTGVENDMAPAETVGIALRLQPGTKNVVVVGSGIAPFEREQLATVKKELKAYEGRVDISYLPDLAMPDLLERLGHLPSNTLVLLTSVGQDAAGTHFKSNEAGRMIAAAANAPVFTLFDVYINHGEVGGYVSSLSEQGKEAGSMALRVLKGEKPRDIPRVLGVNAYMFDWRAIKRWGLKDSEIPPGSIVLNRQPTVWESYRWYIISGISLILLEASLIGGLVWQRARRRKAETAVRDRDDRLRLLLDSTAEAIYGIDLEHRCTFCNPACLRTLRYERVDEVLGKNMHELIHHTRADGTPFPVEECRVHRLIRTGEGVHAEDEFLWRANGTSFPAEYWSHPQRRGQSVVGAVVAFVDITERKLAEAALANVSRKLIEAQEQERSRIGRELHDDINQRLAMLAVELERLQDYPSEVRSGLQELRKQTTELSNDVQALSHELHSSKLEYLGAIGGMKSWCKEFGERQGIQIEFKSTEVQTSVAPEVGLCLFRVLQEALHNAVKHSGVKRIEVQLREDSGEIHLVISDLGRGFDLETATQGRGLGLTSMQERVRLVNGIVEIQSKPMGGTTVHVRVPLTSEPASQRAAG